MNAIPLSRASRFHSIRCAKSFHLYARSAGATVGPIILVDSGDTLKSTYRYGPASGTASRSCWIKPALRENLTNCPVLRSFRNPPHREKLDVAYRHPLGLQ